MDSKTKATLSPAAQGIVDAIDAAALAIEDIKELFADGSIGWSDIPILFQINDQVPEFEKAFSELGQILPNIRSIDPSEVTVIEKEALKLLAQFGINVPGAGQ